MTNQDAGKDALVTVGWGAAETQFQGSAGKVGSIFLPQVALCCFELVVFCRALLSLSLLYRCLNRQGAEQSR